MFTSVLNQLSAVTPAYLLPLLISWFLSLCSNASAAVVAIPSRHILLLAQTFVAFVLRVLHRFGWTHMFASNSSAADIMLVGAATLISETSLSLYLFHFYAFRYDRHLS